MILLTLSRGKGEETVRLQLPASPAEIGETFAFLDRISLDTTATAILDVSSNVPVLYRCLYDVDVEDSEQFQKLQKLAERTEALSPAKAAIFSGALDAECVWNLEGALTVADRLDEYILVDFDKRDDDKTSANILILGNSGQGIEMDEIPAIQELLKDAKSFCCYGFDCYERYWDITDEEYLAQLETKREEITHEILERCRTKRKNLYITGPVALNVAQKFSVHRLCDKEGKHNLANRFVGELMEQLVQDGLLVTTKTRNGPGVRTATDAEISSPLPGQQQMTL